MTHKARDRAVRDHRMWPPRDGSTRRSRVYANSVPHVSEIWLIEHYVTATYGTPLSVIAQLGVASPDFTEATR